MTLNGRFPRLIVEFGRHRLMLRPGLYRFGFRRISPQTCSFGLGLAVGNHTHRKASAPPHYRVSVRRDLRPVETAEAA